MKQQKKVTYGKSGGFTNEVKAVVNNYFETNKINKEGDWRLYLKTFILFSLFFCLYFVLVFVNFAPWPAYLLSLFLMGHYVIPSIGFCVMHDAIHGSYSKKRGVNYLAGLSLNFLGAINFLWKTKHNQIHHTNTNIDEFDEDIEAGPILRLHPNQPWKPIHKYQHKWWYWRGVYSLLYLHWVWYKDYKKYFTKKILYKSIEISKLEHFVFWFSKIFYIFIFVVLPVVMVGFWWWLFGYIFVSLVCSLRISTIFQLAHVVEGADQSTSENVFEKEFFIHQAEATADFAVDNKLVSWLTGGLNFQIEHHLFPNISHIHYPAIHLCIKPVFKKWGVQMNVNETVSSAISSHVQTLFLLGRGPGI